MACRCLLPTPPAPRRLSRAWGLCGGSWVGCALRGADVAALPPLLCAQIPNLSERGMYLLPALPQLSCLSAEVPQGQAWFCLEKATKINLVRGSREVTVLLPSPSPAPKRSTGPLFLEGFRQVSIFFLLLLTKNPGWLRNLCAAAPARSHGSNPAPANLCQEGRLVPGWPSGMLLGGTHRLAQGCEQVPVVDRRTDGLHRLVVDPMLYHLLVELCSRGREVLEVRQGLN